MAADYPVYKPYIAALERKPPTPTQLRISSLLEKHIDQINPREVVSEKKVREEVLLELSKLVNNWVKDILDSKNIPQSSKVSGQLFVSGSYRLGVNSKNDDVDTICCVPKYISREDFFSEDSKGFLSLLRKLHGVTRVNPLKEVVVPIIEMEWRGIELDVLLARLEQPTVPPLSMILNDRLLIGLDDTTVRSINGPRVTELLIKLVPNYPNFCLVLRCVRKWAKVRGIYSNKMGYLGGVNYSILVAFCCQLYPTASCSKLLQRFFALYCEWNWPTEIRLCHSYERDYLHMKQWDPSKDKSEQFHVMPIITPAYPQQTSSYNVSHASLDIMLDEFHRAKEICSLIIKNVGRLSDEEIKPDVWDPLFQESEFFVMFGSYLNISLDLLPGEKIPDGDTTEEKLQLPDLKSWSGYVESRLRKLTEGLQKFPLRKIFLFPKKFQFNGKINYFVGLLRHPNKLSNRKRLDFSYEVKAWVDSLYAFSKFEKSVCSVKAGICKWSALPDDPSIFPNGKKLEIPLRKVWIFRRKLEQQEFRSNPNSNVERRTYADFSQRELDILAGKTVSDDVEAIVEKEEPEDIEQQEENILLTKRLREEEKAKSNKRSVVALNLDLPFLPGIDLTSMSTYFD